MKMIKRVFGLFLALTLCLGFFPAQALAEGAGGESGLAELKSDNLQVEATSSLGRAFQNTMAEQTDPEETSPYRINGVAVEDGEVTVSYTSAEDAEVLVAIYEDRSDALKLITTLRLEVSAEEDTVVGTLPEETPEYFLVGAYLIRSGSHEPLCEEYSSSYYTRVMQEFMSAPLTDFAEEADDRLVILDRGAAIDGSEADFLIFREGTVILQETETENRITKNEDGSYTITGADASALALRAGDKIGCKMLGDRLDVFLVESVVSVSGDAVVFTENPDVNMETFFETIRIDDMPDPETVEYDTSDMMPGFSVREEGDLATEVAPIYEAASRLEDGEALPESFGDIVVMGGPPGTSSTSVEASICLDINIGVQSMTELYNGLTQAPDPNRFNVFKEKEFDWSGDVSAEGSFSVGSTLEMEFYLTGSYNYFSVSLSFTKILNLKIQGMLCGEFMIVKVKYPTPLLGVAVTGDLKLILEFSAELSFVASWSSRLSFEYDSDRPVGYRWKNTSSGSDAKPKTSLALKGKLEFGIKVSVGIEFISEKLGSVKLSAKASVVAEAELESSILRRLNQGIESWHDLVYDGQSVTDPSLASASEIHECDNCIDGTIKVKLGIGADFSMLFGVLSTSVDANLFTVDLGNFYYSFDTKDHGWGRCPHRRYRLSLTVIDGLDYTLGDVIANWYDQDSVEAQNAAKHAIQDARISVADKSGQYIQDRELITGADGKVSFFLPVGKYTVKGFNIEYYGEHDFEMYDSARDCYLVLEKMAGESHAVGNISWTFYPNGLLSISGTGAIGDYSLSDRPPWEIEVPFVNTIILQNGITRIGAYSFQEFEHVTEIQLPASLECIGDHAFQNCSGLKQITLPTSLTEIGADAFGNCAGMKKAIYNGPETQWAEEVTVGPGNEPLTGHLVFNSLVLASGQCGAYLFWSLSSSGTLTISGTGPMTEYAKAEDVPWYKYRAKIDTLLIEQGATSLSPFAFVGCAIQELALPGSVTSLGRDCFAGCAKLIRVHLLEGGITQIPERCFGGCSELKTINIPLCVTSIGMNAFYACFSLKEASYPGLREEWNARVRLGDGNSCLLNALKTVDSEMESIGMCGPDAEAFTSAFKDGTHLIISGSGDITERPWSSIASDIAAVHFKGNITGLCQDAFLGCRMLKSIAIPDTVTAIGARAFASCSDLAELTIPTGVESIGPGILYNCGSLCSLSIPFVGSSRNATATGYNGTISNYSDDSFHRLDGFFKYYTSVSGGGVSFSGTLPQSLTTVHVTNANQIPDQAFGNYRVANGGSFIYYTYAPVLEVLTLNEGIRSIGSDAFRGQSKLVSLPIPTTVTSIGARAYSGCSHVTDAVIPSGVTAINDETFYGCAGLPAIPIPSSVKSIGTQAFAYCTGLTAAEIPGTVEEMGLGIFNSCSALTCLSVPFVGSSRDATVTGDKGTNTTADDTFSRLDGFFKYYGTYSGGGRAFSGTMPDALTEVHVTDATQIPDQAFCYYRVANGGSFLYYYYAPVLTALTLNEGIESIGENAFRGQSSLQELTFDGTMEAWQAISIGSGNTPLYGIPIHCLDGDLTMDPANALEAPEEPEDAEEPLEAGELEGGSIGLIEPAEEPVIEPTPTEEPEPVVDPAPTEEPGPGEEGGIISLASFQGAESAETGAETSYTASFGGLMPGEEYLILAVRSDDESILLENDNILFVGQQEADENGALSIRYIKKSNEPALLRCYGMSDKCFTGSDKLDVVISMGATDSQAYSLAVSYDGVELVENRDYLVSFDYLEDEVIQITLKGIVDYSGSAVILAKISCTEEDSIDGYAVIHTAHQWGEPVWTWAEDGSHAEATFTCANDERHTLTRAGEIGVQTENNVTVLTASVNAGGKTWTDIRRIVHGDLNADGEVDSLDLLVMRKLLLGLSQAGQDRADVNGDGILSILDLVRLRRHLAGMEVTLR